MASHAQSSSNGWVICLCAQWCNVCRDWRDAFAEAAAAQGQWRFAWVDVEDEADAMGDFDIETFPTVLIARGGNALFLGPVQPSGGQLARLVASFEPSSGARPLADVQARSLLARLEASVLPKL